MKNFPFITAALALLAPGCKTAETALAPSDLQVEVVRDECIASLENADVEVRITNRSSSNLVANVGHFYLGGIIDENGQYVMSFMSTGDLIVTSPHWDSLPQNSTVSVRVNLIELRKYPVRSGQPYTLELGYFLPKTKGRNAVKNEMPAAKVRSKQIRICP